MIVIPQLAIGYQQVPKIATTSWFSWLFYATGEEGIRGAEGKRRYFKNGKDSILIDNTESAVSDYKHYYRFALTRDPVKRFLSMYSNRVVYFRELSSNAKCAAQLTATGLQVDPQINELVSHLEQYLATSGPINHHSLPMMHFMGPDLSVYGRIVDISESPRILEEIRAHWKSIGLFGPLERASLELQRLQSGGPKLGLNALTPDSFEHLLDFYRSDYENIPTINLDAIKEEYRRASEGGIAPPVDFTDPHHSKALKKKKSKPKQRKHAAAGQALTVTTEHNSLVEDARIRLDQTPSDCRLKGYLLLHSGNRAGWRIIVRGDGWQGEGRWGIPSPQVAVRFPDNAMSPYCRFKVDNLPIESLSDFSLLMQSDDGSEYLLARISRMVKYSHNS